MKILYVINNVYTLGNGLAASCRHTVERLREAGHTVRLLTAQDISATQQQNILQTQSNVVPANGTLPQGSVQSTKIQTSQTNQYNGANDDFILPTRVIPIVDILIRKQGYSFAKPDDDIIREAVHWADVVHLEEPFALEEHVVRIAKQEEVPLTATYHLHPENMFASVHLHHVRWLNEAVLHWWIRHIFNHCQIVQCPSMNVLERLRSHGCTAQLRVISNGLIPDIHCIGTTDGSNANSNSQRGSQRSFVDILKVSRDNFRQQLQRAKSPKFAEQIRTHLQTKRVQQSFQSTQSNTKGVPLNPARFTVITAGRYSVEKDQRTLLEAMRYSKYASQIQLVFAGRGPLKRELKRQARSLVRQGVLAHKPEFAFYTSEQLHERYSSADLYVHCATVEVEGLSCMEALQEGLVPVIASGELTATSQFALYGESIYPAGNARALATRIDYWLEHDQLRLAKSQQYRRIDERYDITRSIEQLCRMYEDAVS